MVRFGSFGLILSFFLCVAPAVASPRHLFLFGGGDLASAALDHFVALAGDKAARVLVIGWTTESPVADEDIVTELRDTYRIKAVLLAPDIGELSSDAQHTLFLQQLAQATGVFFCGGDQTRAVAAIDKYGFRKTLQDKFRKGFVFGGTSAGMALTSVRMPTGDIDSSGHWVTVPGLGLLPPAIFVDTHFLVRHREPRMRDMMSRGSETVGLGVDEGTALEVQFDPEETPGRLLTIQEGLLATQEGPSHVTELTKDGNGGFRSHLMSPGDSVTVE